MSDDKLEELYLDKEIYLGKDMTELGNWDNSRGSKREDQHSWSSEEDPIELPDQARVDEDDPIVSDAVGVADVETGIDVTRNLGVDTEKIDAIEQMEGIGDLDLGATGIGTGTLDRGFGQRILDETKKHLGLNVFEAVVEAIDTEYWNPAMMNSFQYNPRELFGSGSNDAYEELFTGVQDHDFPTRQNNYRGKAGELSVEQFGEWRTNTDTEYDPANDAQPVSEMAHGALMHAAGVLMRYDAETEGDGIRVENLSTENAEEVVQAYTVIDSLLQSESWDQRTIMEKTKEDIESYGTEEEYAFLDS